MNYAPCDTTRSLHDTWIFLDGDDIHLFYLSPMIDEPKHRLIGHARSDDWLHWEELPTIELTGPAGSWDSGRIGTGHTFRHDGKYYMAYTGRVDPAEDIGLAASDDLITWQKVHDFPVCKRSQNAPYDRTDAGVDLATAWRDPFITQRESGKLIALITARIDAGEVTRRACAALCELNDLSNWKVAEPIAAIDTYAIMEVPEVFYFHDTWWLTFNGGTGWGRRLDVASRTRSTGTYFLKADALEGPWTVPDDNLLIGTAEGRRDALVARSIEYRGERLVYHHYDGAFSHPSSRALGVPKKLDVVDGRLVLRPWRGLDAIRTNALEIEGFAPVDVLPWSPGSWRTGRVDGPALSVEGTCIDGVSAQLTGVSGRNIDFEGRLTVANGRGGFAGLDESRSSGTFVLFDAERDVATTGVIRRGPYGMLLDNHLDLVAMKIGGRESFDFRVIARDRYVEVYVDDLLLFSTITQPAAADWYLAAIVDCGSCVFDFGRCHALEPMVRPG